jgi:hypothetical protein
VHEQQWNGRIPPVVEYRSATDSEFTFGYHTGEVWEITKQHHLEEYFAQRTRAPLDEVNTIPEIPQGHFGHLTIDLETRKTATTEKDVGAKRLVEMGIDSYRKRFPAAQVEQTMSKKDGAKIKKAIQKVMVGHGYLEEADLRMVQRDLARWAIEHGLDFMRWIYSEAKFGTVNLVIVRMCLYYGLKQNNEMVI